jgi:hypothetical protein
LVHCSDCACWQPPDSGHPWMKTKGQRQERYRLGSRRVRSLTIDEPPSVGVKPHLSL